MNDRLLAASRIPAAALAMGVSLTSCGGAADASRMPSPTQFIAPALPAHLADSPVVLHPWSAGGMGAMITGRLVNADGCLLLEVDTGGRVLPSFPYPGTDWDGTAVVMDDELLPIGAPVTLGGGEVDLSAGDIDRFSWVKAPDSDCLVGKAWVVYGGSDPP